MESTQQTGPDAGGDQWGRVEYSSYFRPPGLPGLVTPSAGQQALTSAVTFPWTSTEAYPTTMVTNIRPDPRCQHPRATATRCTASRPSGSRT